MPSETNNDAPLPPAEELQQKIRNLQSYIEGYEAVSVSPVCVITQEGVITDTNPPFVDFLHTNKEALLQSSLNNWLLNDDITDIIAETENTEESHKFDFQTANSVRKSATVNIKPWYIEGEVHGYFLGVVDNIPSDNGDGQTKAEIEDLLERVKEQQMRTQSIVYNISDGVLFLDRDGIVTTANPSALSMLGVQSGDLLKKSLSDLTGNKIADKLDSMIQSGDCMREELSVESDVYFEVTTTQIGEGDSGAQTIAILHDVSQKRQIEEMKLEFASVAAHQMRTPLSTIRWSLEILSKEIEDEELLTPVRRGYKSIQHVLNVVNELLNVDRLEEGKSAYSFQPLDVIALIDNCIETQVNSQQVIDQPAINFQKPNDPIPKVRGDKEKLKVVFKNLIENAVKYTDADGQVEIRVNIKVTSGYAGDAVVVSVEDSGIGIPESAEDDIFSKFYRADNATERETDGTGVGLFITKRIVEAHNGDIWFESTVGEGTTFHVQLPIATES